MPGSVSDKGNGSNDWQSLKEYCAQYSQGDKIFEYTIFKTLWGSQAWLPCTGDAASLWANFAPSYSPTGDCWSGSSVGNSSGSSKVTDDMTPEEKLAAREEEAQEDAEKQKLVDKFNNMYELLEKYGETLSETTSPKKSAFTSILSKYKANVSTSTSTDVLNQKIDDLNELFKKYKTKVISKVAKQNGYRTTEYSKAYKSNEEKKYYYFDEDTCSFKELFGVNTIDKDGKCSYPSIKNKKTFEEAKAFSKLATDKGLKTTSGKYYYSEDEEKFYSYDETKKEFVAVNTDTVAQNSGYRKTLCDGIYYNDNQKKHYYLDNGDFKELFNVEYIYQDGKCDFLSGINNRKTLDEAKSISEKAAELKLRKTDYQKAFYSEKDKQHYYYNESSKEFISLDKNIKKIYDNGRCAMQDGTMKTLNPNTMELS